MFHPLRVLSSTKMVCLASGVWCLGITLLVVLFFIAQLYVLVSGVVLLYTIAVMVGYNLSLGWPFLEAPLALARVTGGLPLININTRSDIR